MAPRTRGAGTRQTPELSEKPSGSMGMAETGFGGKRLCVISSPAYRGSLRRPAICSGVALGM